ncbi:MAG: hypothetical protein Q9208_000523 [Pyrenodesmia sp. 3 TL-2023]
MTNRQLQERFQVIVASSDERVEGDADNLGTHLIRENEASTSNHGAHIARDDAIERTGDGRQEEPLHIVEEALDETPEEPQVVEEAHLEGLAHSETESEYGAADLVEFTYSYSRESFARWLRWQVEIGAIEDRGQIPQHVAQYEEPIAPPTASRPAALAVPIKARSSKCPLCRRPAFDKAFRCHDDAIQLIRLRLRLCDFAYAVTNLCRSEPEELERAEIRKFLERRYNDNVALGEQEDFPSIEGCRDLLAYARWELQGQVRDYLNNFGPDFSDSEKERVGRLGAVFDNYILRAAHIPFFFDGHPALNDHEWKWHFSEEDRRTMQEDPKVFFRNILLVPVAIWVGDGIRVVNQMDEPAPEWWRWS